MEMMAWIVEHVLRFVSLGEGGTGRGYTRFKCTIDNKHA